MQQDYRISRADFMDLLGLKSPDVNNLHNRCGRRFELYDKGKELDLAEVVKALHQTMLERVDNDKATLETEKLQHEITKLKLGNAKTLMESRARAKELCDVSVVRKSLQILANELRTTGELFARMKTLTGPEAQDLLNAALDRTEQSLEQFD